MKPEKVKALLTLLGIDVPNDQPRTGWVICHCPLGPWRHSGGKSSAGRFGVKLETGDPRANCFSCGWRGTLMDLVILMRSLNKTEHHLDVKWSGPLSLIEEAENTLELELDGPTIDEIVLGDPAEDHVFPDWWLESFVPWDQNAEVVAYLKERGVPKSAADMLGLRADSSQHRVCFPVHDFDARLRGLHGRAMLPQIEPRYRMYLQAGKNNPDIWLGERWVDTSKPMVMVEGPFDVASVMRVYRNVTTPLFASPSYAKLHRMADCMEWITLLDHGTGGNAGRARVTNALHSDHVLTHLTPPPHRKDPGAMTIPELQELLGKYVKLDTPLLD